MTFRVSENEGHKNTVELGHNIMKWTKYSVSLYTGVVITEECNVTVSSEELIGAREYLTL